MNTISDTSALIFAGSRGIGRATALRLAREGASVVVGYASNEAAAGKVVEQIRALGGQAHAVRVDVADPQAVKAAFDEAIRHFDRVDVVVNAAAVSVFGPLGSLDPAAVRRALDVNAMGAFHVLHEAAARVADGGRIIHISTGGTKMPIAGGGVYAGAKAAGEHMALGLAKELGSRGVTVNVVSPGATDTDGLVMPKEQVEQLVAQTPLGRLGKPEDIADAIALLASPDARWVNGQNLGVNGGIL
ncbi:MAG: SDR family oxidoreductase [Myxococcota bacterium]